MHCPTLSELPPPPPGKDCSPSDRDQNKQRMEDKSQRNPCPWVSIVTPSYNQVQFIEETILSVSKQNYANQEHIVMDGGSTDTVGVLRRYEGTYNLHRT